MESTKKKLCVEKWLCYLFSFLLPVIIMLLVLRAEQFYPFGDKTLFFMDMKNEYLEYFSYLRYMFGGDNSFFYCWSRSLGGNFMGLFAYYLASPLSFITLFFPLENMHQAILFLTLLKIGLCGLSFSVFAHYIWERKNTGKHVFDAWAAMVIITLSVSYALMSYNMVYSICLMWIDGVIMLPVVMLGVEKLIDGKKGLHYMLSLAAIFIINYYTGYMIGIFTAIYFVYRMICRVSKENAKKCFQCGLKFTLCTIIAIGLSAPLLYPVFKDLFVGKLTVDNVPNYATNFELIDFLGKFRNGVYDTITNSVTDKSKNLGLPSIYCGYAVLILAIMFFFLRKISVREKIGAALIFAIFTASFYYTDLDIIWHGFQSPVWYPNRYAFLFSFFMIYIAFCSICVFMCGEQKINCPEKIKIKFGQNYKHLKKYLCVFAVALCVLSMNDMQMNATELIYGLELEFEHVSVEHYEKFLDKTVSLVDTVKEQDDGLYRMNASFGFSRNDAMLLGYNGMRHFSSTYNRSVNDLTKKLGLAQNFVWNSGYGSNPLIDSLFSVYYKMYDTDNIFENEIICEPESTFEPEKNYEKILDEGKKTAVYKNNFAIPMLYAADVSNLTPALDKDVFSNQNEYLNALSGKNETFFRENKYSYNRNNSGWSYTLSAISDGPMYIYMGSDYGSNKISNKDYYETKIYANEVIRGEYFISDKTCSVYLGDYKKGDNVEVRVESFTNPDYIDYSVISTLDMEVLQNVLDGLRKGQCEISSHSGGKIEGVINVSEGQTVVSSIPYDAGWTVTVDGREVELKKFAGTFLAFDAPSGKHTIEFSYMSPGVVEGLCVFAVAFVAALLYFRRRQPKKV